MTSRGLIVAVMLLAAMVLGWVIYEELYNVHAASRSGIHRVGILVGVDYYSPSVDGFKEKMESLGYKEGENISYDVQKTKNAVGNAAVIEHFIQERDDLIVAMPTDSAIEAKTSAEKAGVAILAVNAVFEGTALAQTLADPGGNLTGVRLFGPQVALQRLEVLHELVPAAKRLLVPYRAEYPSGAPELEALQSAADSLGVTLVPLAVKTSEELDAYLNAHASGDIGVDAILELPESLSVTQPFMSSLAAYAKAHALPLAGSAVTAGADGPLFSLMLDPGESGALAAPIADKIFRGIPAGSIPVVTATPHLLLNYAVAQRLGIEVDESFLARADEIVR